MILSGSKNKKPKREKAKGTKPAAEPAMPVSNPKEKFDQLIDDAIFGVTKKKTGK